MKSDWTHSPAASGQPFRAPLPRMDTFDRERFEVEHLATRQPVLIKGAARSWPATASWTPEYLAERFGDVVVRPSMDLPDTEVPYLHVDDDFRQTMPVREFVRRLRAGSRCYIDQSSIDHYAGLDADFDFGIFTPVDIHVIALWLGSRTHSGLHYDWVDNWFAQVYGNKHAILASPDEVRNLYPFSDSHTKSRVSPLRPDLRAHPRFGRASLLEAVLEPGDVLFIPRGWWHYFASPGASISLTCWYGPSRTPTDELRSVLASRRLDVWIRMTRDFLWHGVLGRPYKSRLYSLPPTGVLLHEHLAAQINAYRQRF